MLYNKRVNLEDRYDMPLDGLSNYRVRNNTIYTYSIELNAVRHCNLSCRGCSHSSPIAPKNEIDPSVASADLFALSHFLKCKTIRILGGEPLLHSSLKNLLKEIKNSNISTSICLVTNGTLLQLIDDDFTRYIDEVQISLYQLKTQKMNEIRMQAKRLINMGIKVELKEIPFFRESICQKQTDNPTLINMVYESCVIAHVWRCITIDNGRLYRCPQSLFYAENSSDYSDCINIQDIQCVNDLLEFLENNDACKACSQCLGSIGNLFPHEQIKKELWKKSLPQSPETGIDFDFARGFRIV